MRTKESVIAGIILVLLTVAVTRLGRMIFSVVFEYLGVSLMLIGVMVIIVALLSATKPINKSEKSEKKRK